MARAHVIILHRRSAGADQPLVRLLDDIREHLANEHVRRFAAAGATVQVMTAWPAGKAFGEVLAELAPSRGGLVVLSSGAVPLLLDRDVARLVATATAGESSALTNNRYSSDVCAIGQAAVLRRLPALQADNGLPRWLAEQAGFTVAELPGRQRLALDLDTPLDAALIGLHVACPAWLREIVGEAGLAVPRLNELRALAADPSAELLVFGRSGSRTLRWLERNVRCRVRFLAEERGLRSAAASQRPPRATIGRLLGRDGPGGLASLVAQLADGAILDTRVLLADRLGADETAWPPAADRYASDLLRPAQIEDSWLRELTVAALESKLPILLGAHSVVGPGIPLLLGGAREVGATEPTLFPADVE